MNKNGGKMLKRVMKKLIEQNEFLLRLYVIFFNRLSGGKIMMSGVRIRNNRINILGLGNILQCKSNCSITNNPIHIFGNNNRISMGNNVQLHGDGNNATILVSGNNNTIEIMDNCRFLNVQFFIKGDDNTIRIRENCSAVYTCFHIESDSGKKENLIEIGEETTIHGRNEKQVEIFLDEGTKVIIGKDCMLSNNILIRTTDSHSIIDTRSGQRVNYAKDVIIGDHCWISANATILKGVSIPEQNIVAAGSICTKTYSKTNTVLAGNPAEMVKQDVNWCRKQL